ncbi:MAG: hypothetical protein KDJ62_02305 [Rhodobiaceae bacterium]|nr:hypothetical protein [Rhodobiaceae bacterium]MCC0049089.1 hypothetical protein [Rhodobiaceae bacterium]
MSELIDQLRNLRAAAYRKLTQNSDFKVLLELDEMLGRLDASDTPMAPPASPQAKSDDEDAEADEDIEAAPPEPAAEPPPAEEPAREEIQLADESVVETETDADDAEPDVLVMASAGAEKPAAVEPASAEEPVSEPETAEAEPVAAQDGEPEAAEAAEETPVAAMVEETPAADTPSAEDMPDEVLADEEAFLAEALADDIGAGGDSQTDEPAGKPEADVFSSDETAVEAVAAALSEASAPKPAAARKPAPVNLAPEEDYDAAAPSGTAETSDDAYESALNRLNALIERASTRLKREDGESNGASVA